jgi:hypothetical protein
MNTEIFKFSKEHDNKEFEIRFLPNIKNFKEPIIDLSYRLKNVLSYKYISYALVDNELKVFIFGRTFYNKCFISKNDNLSDLHHKVKYFDLKNDLAVKVKILNVQGYVNIDSVEDIHDKKYNFNDNRDFIQKILKNTDLNIYDVKKQEQEKIDVLINASKFDLI